MAKSKISFTFEENPQWRKVDKSTSDMLKDIVAWRKEYEENFTSKSSQECVKMFSQATAVDYILNLNLEEMVGTQTREDTEEVLTTSEFNSKFENPQRRETMGVYKAMKKFYALHKEMKKTGLLTVDQICSIHGVLLDGIHRDNGEIRKTQAYTSWNKEFHLYPPPDITEGLFYALIDHHNICIQSLPSDKTSEEYVSHIFKCAARLLFEFVDTHPFGDGNGRMCRLLANHIVGLITPFPVALFHEHAEGNRREDYIEAIVRCRENPEEGPRELGAMLVEGAWIGWKKLLSELKKNHPCVSIVVQKSLCTASYIMERINRIWGHFQELQVKVTKEEACQLAVDEVLKSNLESLSSNQYLPLTVPLDDKVNLFIDIIQ